LKKVSKKNIESKWLEQAGFNFSNDIWVFRKNPPLNRGKSDRSANLIKLDSCQVVGTKTGYLNTAYSLKMDLRGLCKQIKSKLKQSFKECTSCDVTLSNEVNSLWVFCEFSNKNIDSISKYSTAGFQVKFVVDNNTLSIMFVDQFYLGEIPSRFFYSIPKTLAKIFKIENVTFNSIYELSVTGLTEIVNELCFSKLENSDRPDLQQIKMSYDLSLDASAITIRAEASDMKKLASISQDLPVAVLESRSAQTVLKPVDDNLSSKYRGGYLLGLSDNVESVAVLRRLALSSSEQIIAKCYDLIEKNLVKESGNLSFISAVVLFSASGKNFRRCVNKIASTLISKVVDIESVSSLEVVLPYYLYLAYQNDSQEKAEASLKKIIESRGELPEVLELLVDFSRQQKDSEKEMFYLGKQADLFTDLEDRGKTLLELSKRTALSGKDKELAISYGRKAVDLLESKESFFHLTDLLLADARYLAAIDVLNQFKNIPTMEKTITVDIDLRLARIWNDHLDRPDMAMVHYEYVIALDERCSGAVDKLVDIYRDNKNAGALIPLLESRFNVALNSKDHETSNNIRKELFTHYQNDEKKCSLLMEMISKFPKRHFDLDILRSLELKKSTWMEVISVWRQKVEQVDNEAERAYAYVELGQMSALKQLDKSMVVDLYLDALHCGWIDDISFEFVVDYLASNKDYPKLADCYHLRLSMLSENLQIELLQDILGNRSQVFTEEDLDKYSLLIYSISSENKSYLYQRFDYYGSIEKLNSVKNLMLSIEGLGEGSFHLDEWLALAIEAINRSSDSKKFHFLKYMFNKRLSLSQEDPDILREAISCFTGSGDEETLKHYCALLIEQDVLPSLNSTILLKLFPSPSIYRAKVLRWLAERSLDEDIRTKLYYQAFEEFNVLEDRGFDAEVCLTHFSKESLASESDLESLRALTEKSKNWSSYQSVLDKQIGLRQPEDCLRLFKEAIEIAIIENGDSARAGSLVKKGLELGFDSNELLDSYIENELIEQGVAPDVVVQRVFNTALEQGDLVQAVRSWIYQVFTLKDKNELTTFIHWTKEQLTGANSKLSWKQLSSSVLESKRKLHMVGEIHTKLMLEMGIYLFDFEQYSEQAYLALKQVYRSRPEEATVWVPLYLLLRSYGSSEDLLSYISGLIPKVENSPDILDPYPITLESLETELNRLGVSEGEVSAVGFSHDTVYTPPLPPDTQPRNNLANETKSWRSFVSELDVPENFCHELFLRPISSAIEKHVGLQACALLSGDLETLKQWHWQVWRNPDQYGYKLEGRNRYPEDGNLAEIQSPLHRLLLFIAPVLIQMHRDKFSAAVLSTKLGQSMKQISGSIKKLSWDDSLFSQTGLTHYQDILVRQKFNVFHLPGMKSEIFYEGSTRNIYFDKNVYASLPGSVLFHKIFGVLWSVKLRYFPLLHLNPRTDVIPLILAIQHQSEGTGIRAVKRFLGAKPTALEQSIQSLDLSELEHRFSQIVDFNTSEVERLWKMMRRHILRLQLAETLDLVGLAESIISEDIVDKGELAKGEILSKHDCLEDLIVFSTKLKL